MNVRYALLGVFCCALTGCNQADESPTDGAITDGAITIDADAATAVEAGILPDASDVPSEMGDADRFLADGVGADALGSAVDASADAEPVGSEVPTDAHLSDANVTSATGPDGNDPTPDSGDSQSSVVDAGGRDDRSAADDTGSDADPSSWDTATPRAASDAASDVLLSDRAPPDEIWCGNQAITATRTIEGGRTVAICAGSVITLGPSVALVVQGTLLAQGTAAAPVKLIGEDAKPGAWGGLTVYAGGNVELKNTEVQDASMAFSTAISAHYSLDHVVLNNSRQLMHLMSAGTITHATMHAVGESQGLIGDAIIIDDASPYFGDSTLDNGSTGGDLIQVNGVSSGPVFERMEVSHSHCGFHFNDSTNAVITSSYIHDCEYGLMVIRGIGSLLSGSNFERNSFALGWCFGGTATFRDNYVDGTFVDSYCSQLPNEAPATSPLPTVGPLP